VADLSARAGEENLHCARTMPRRHPRVIAQRVIA